MEKVVGPRNQPGGPEHHLHSQGLGQARGEVGYAAVWKVVPGPTQAQHMVGRTCAIEEACSTPGMLALWRGSRDNSRLLPMVETFGEVHMATKESSRTAGWPHPTLGAELVQASRQPLSQT